MSGQGVQPIAVIQGAPGVAIQRMFRDLIVRWTSTARLVGVVEHGGGDETASNTGHLRSIADGHRYTLFQDLGAGATGCSLDPAGAVMASEALRRQIAAGCDLVVLSKFGKMEAESGSGLLPAFIAAVEGGVPVLTSVAPRYDASWTRFADPLFVRLPPDAGAVERWWRDVRRQAVSPFGS